MADTNSDKLDKIIRVVTRTEVQVEALMKADAHTRITKLEQAHKFWKMMAMAVPSFSGLIFGAYKFLESLKP
jgi:hypothetical protein